MHHLAQRVLEIVGSLRLRVTRLLRRRELEINIDVFANPEKYLIRLPIEKLVADTKVDPEALDVQEEDSKRRENCAPNSG